MADVLADGLARAGATRVFAASDDDDTAALIRALDRRGLDVVRVSGPDVACVMAAVSGALDGTPGVALVGARIDPASAGLAYASLDRGPAVVVGSGGSIAAASDPGVMTKGAIAVTAESAGHAIARACRLAMTEPWGPVQLDVPPAVVAASALPVTTSCRPGPPGTPDAAQLDAAVRLLEASERPVLVVGLLCRSGAEAAWVRPFAEARPAPVLATPRGRGIVPDPHPLLIGTLDAGEAERALLASADLVVAIGLDPGEVRGRSWPSTAPVLHLTPVVDDAPPAGRIAVVGDIGLILEELAPRLRDRRLAEWDVARLHALKRAAGAPPADARQLAAHRAVETARRLTPAGTIAVFDGGELWPVAARAWQAVAPGECLISSGPATAAYAVAAATAAQLERPGRRVVCFSDVDAIRGSRDDLATLAALGLPVVIVVLKDAGASTLATAAGLRSFDTASIGDLAFEAALGAGAPAILGIGPGRQDTPEK